MELRAAALALALGLLVQAAPAAAEATRRLFLAGMPYELEVASDPPSRERGLMGRADVPARGGMLFIFPDDAPRAFWMRNCLVDIDVAFLDRGGRIVATHAMRAEPLRREHETEEQYLLRLRHYASSAPARFAIELRAGSLAKLGLVVGGQVDVTGIPLPTR